MAIITHLVFEYDDDSSWSTLRSRLKLLVHGWVYSSHIPCWQGQEEEIVDDIVSESISHIFERLEKANSGVAEPIVSILAFARKTAYHCYVDQMRKDRRKIRLSQMSDSTEKPLLENRLQSMEEVIQEKVMKEQLFKLVAHEISHFPKKQREAILKDQARRLDQMADPLPLLRAYLDAGIQLLDYRKRAPANQNESGRHNSLLYHAYRRLSSLPSVRAFI